MPTEPDGLGKTARGAMPRIEQLFVAPTESGVDTMALERRAFVLRKRVEHAVDDLYFPSLSARTIVYKGMLTSEQLREFFPDLRDPTFESGLALVHSRFSTNTFPSWPLAHPYRYLCHNGEINTLAGNRNWMRAREALLETSLIEGDLSRDLPDLHSGRERLGQLRRGARAPASRRALAAARRAHDDPRGVGEPHPRWITTGAPSTATTRRSMEPWDGPAAVCFTDGTVVGAVLDRNGLRPARYWVTDDGLVVLASEVGVLDIAPERVVRKGRLQPGRMFLVDTSKGRLVEDEEIKAELASQHPYDEWLATDQVRLEELPARTMLTPQHGRVVTQQQLFGYTNEELRVIVAPMARTGVEPNGSMGSDTSIAVLSSRARLLYDYFTQLFAQVTNPPLDAIREELVTSLAATIGPEANLLDAGCGSCRQILLPMPVIDRDDLAKLMYVNEHGETPGFKAFAIDGLFDVREAGRAGAPTEAGGEALRPGHRRGPAPGLGRHRGRGQPDRPVGPQRHRRLGADSLPAAHCGDPPPPRAGEDAHEGRPGDRDGRRPRGPPHGAAHRLRGGGREPVPRARLHRRHDLRGSAWRACRPGRPDATTSRRPARAC